VPELGNSAARARKRERAGTIRGDREGQAARPTPDQGPRQTALTAFKEAARSLTRRLIRALRRPAPASLLHRKT